MIESGPEHEHLGCLDDAPAPRGGLEGAMKGVVCTFASCDVKIGTKDSDAPVEARHALPAGDMCIAPRRRERTSRRSSLWLLRHDIQWKNQYAVSGWSLMCEGPKAGPRKSGGSAYGERPPSLIFGERVSP